MIGEALDRAADTVVDLLTRSPVVYTVLIGPWWITTTCTTRLVSLAFPPRR